MKLLEATGTLLLSGLHPSVQDHHIPLWKTGSNVAFQKNAIMPASGHFLLYRPAVTGDPHKGMIDKNIAGVPTVFAGTKTKLNKGTTGTQLVDRTRNVGGNYTLTQSQMWSFASFGDFIFATSGADEVQLWTPGIDDFENCSVASGGNAWDLPNTRRAKVVKTFGPFLMLFNLNGNPQEFIWSDEDNFKVFTPTPTNFARSQVIRDLNSDIHAVTDMPNGLAVWGQDQVHYVSFIGPPFFFGTNHLLNGVGVLGQYAVTPVGNRAFGFGPNGIFMTDYASYVYTDNPDVHAFVFDALDDTRLSEIVVWDFPKETTVFFSYPTIDGVGNTVGYNYKLELWTNHAYWRTAASSGSTFATPLVSDIDGNIRAQGVAGGVSPASAPLTIVPTSILLTVYGSGNYGGLGYGGSLELNDG